MDRLVAGLFDTGASFKIQEKDLDPALAHCYTLSGYSTYSEHWRPSCGKGASPFEAAPAHSSSNATASLGTTLLPITGMKSNQEIQGDG